MPELSFRFEAIGTSWHIESEVVFPKEKQLLLLEEIQKRIAIFDKDYSRFRDDSLVTKMSLEAGEYTLPDDGRLLFDLYRDLYHITGGAVTPLIGQILVDAGYDAKYSLRQAKPLQPPPAWDDALIYSFPKLTLKQPALLDVGAAGKGYLIDIVAGILRKNGIDSFCVDAGGDIFYQNAGNQDLRVGLENPSNTKQVIGVATINNQSICGSAGNRRAWGDFHHIIDPRTLASPRDIAAVWVVADTALLADALTTCLFFVPGELLATKYTFEYVILYADFSIKKSANFRGEFFSA